MTGTVPGIALLLLGMTASQETVSIRKIWDKGEHCAFTDLTRFKGRWFCVFREGKSHAYDDGKIRVLSSADGEAWESVVFLAEAGTDLRDPKISVTPDGRLMLLVGGTIWMNPEDPAKRSIGSLFSLVSLSKDGREWTPFKRVISDGHWLWRVTWHQGVGYGVSKTRDGPPKKGVLWRTRDGLEYERVHDFDVPAMSETTLRFLDDDEAIALTRRRERVDRIEPAAVQGVDVEAGDAPVRRPELPRAARRGPVGHEPELPRSPGPGTRRTPDDALQDDARGPGAGPDAAQRGGHQLRGDGLARERALGELLFRARGETGEHLPGPREAQVTAALSGPRAG